MNDNQDHNVLLHRAGWVALLATATIVGSFIFACALPFAALATLAALFLPRRDAFILVGLSWLANQAIGFGLLHYPHDGDTIGWGVAMGVAALAATAIAMGTEIALRRAGWVVAAVGAFAAAFAGYELVLLATTLVLPSGPGVFGKSVVLYILDVDALAFIGLLLLQGAGQRFGLALPRGRAGTSRA